MRLFNAEPATKAVFGIKEDQDVHDKVIQPKILLSGAVMVQKSSGILTVMGPDMDDMMVEVFKELGSRHLRLGVKAEYFVFQGIALRKTLKEILGEQIYSNDVDCAWKDFLPSSHYMVSSRAYTSRLKPNNQNPL